MGTCGSSLDCTAPEDTVESDPDIAGFGVRHTLILRALARSERLLRQTLISFVTPATITFIAIIVGYLTKSLPDSALTLLDRAYLDSISARKSGLWSKNDSRTTLSQSMVTASNLVGLGGSNSKKILGYDQKSKRARERQKRGLQRFLLALSDQQLVTGIAMMIAGLTKPCSRLGYHFDIIAALGWFSHATHQPTLTLLRDELVDHPRTRDLRVIVLLSISGLLIVFQTGSFSTQENSLPVMCRWRSFWPDLPDAFSIVNLIFILVLIVITAANNIGCLYTSDSDWSVIDWLLGFFSEGVENLAIIHVSSTRKSKVEKSAALTRLRQRQRWVRYCDRWREDEDRWLVETVFLFTELQYSFLSEILRSLFGLVFGITQVFVSRYNTPEYGLSGDQNTIGFGQLVPLLLLTLPMLTAGDLLFGGYNKVNGSVDTCADSMMRTRAQ